MANEPRPNSANPTTNRTYFSVIRPSPNAKATTAQAPTTAADAAPTQTANSPIRSALVAVRTARKHGVHVLVLVGVPVTVAVPTRRGHLVHLGRFVVTDAGELLVEVFLRLRRPPPFDRLDRGLDLLVDPLRHLDAVEGVRPALLDVVEPVESVEPPPDSVSRRERDASAFADDLPEPLDPLPGVLVEVGVRLRLDLRRAARREVTDRRRVAR